MRAPKDKILFTPEPVPESIQIGGITLSLPHKTSHGLDAQYKDWPITGTVSAESNIDIEHDGKQYKMNLSAGDRILFHFNVCSPNRVDHRPKHEGIDWCHPWDIFVIWKDGKPRPADGYILTDRKERKEVVSPSGILISMGSDTDVPAGMATNSDPKAKEGILRLMGEIPDNLKEGSGWDFVKPGYTLVFPEESQIEIRLDGHVSHSGGDVVYRQKYTDIWGYIAEDGLVHPLWNYIFIEIEEEKHGPLIVPFRDDRKDPFTRGRVVMSGPMSEVLPGERVAFNDINKWRIEVGGKTYAVVNADEEGAACVL